MGAQIQVARGGELRGGVSRERGQWLWLLVLMRPLFLGQGPVMRTGRGLYGQENRALGVWTPCDMRRVSSGSQLRLHEGSG